MSKLSILLITGIWAGLVLGLSFIEAPLKFQAPGITTELGLGIGKLVFGTLNKIEIVFCFMLLFPLGSLFREMGNVTIVFAIIIFSIVAIQSLFLLPALNERVHLILSGQEVAPSKHHITFIILEATKLISLLIFFVKTYRI